MLLLLRFLNVFNVFFKIQKNVTFYVFLLCFIRFLELCGRWRLWSHHQWWSQVCVLLGGLFSSRSEHRHTRGHL